MNKFNMGTALPLGIALGAAIGVALDNLAVWIGVGAAFGVALGTSFPQKDGRSDESRKDKS